MTEDKSGNFARDLRKGLMDTWLRFAAGYLRYSGNEFLEGFGVYLEEGYKDAEQNGYVFKEPFGAAKQQALLKKMFDFEAVKNPSMQNKGFALIGKTGFDKLEFIKNYFASDGLVERARRGAEGHYAVADCLKIKGRSSLLRKLFGNKDVPYVIFNNCDSLLSHDWALQPFNILAEASEHSFYSGMSAVGKDGELANFKTDSCYLFLGEENNLHIAVERENRKGFSESAYNHFNAFLTCIHVFDFDTGERYYGHDVRMPGEPVIAGNLKMTMADIYAVLPEFDGNGNFKAK